jgi:hypothetical protein
MICARELQRRRRVGHPGGMVPANGSDVERFSSYDCVGEIQQPCGVDARFLKIGGRWPRARQLTAGGLPASGLNVQGVGVKPSPDVERDSCSAYPPDATRASISSLAGSMPEFSLPPILRSPTGRRVPPSWVCVSNLRPAGNPMDPEHTGGAGRRKCQAGLSKRCRSCISTTPQNCLRSWACRALVPLTKERVRYELAWCLPYARPTGLHLHW